MEFTTPAAMLSGRYVYDVPLSTMMSARLQRRSQCKYNNAAHVRNTPHTIHKSNGSFVFRAYPTKVWPLMVTDSMVTV